MKHLLTIKIYRLDQGGYKAFIEDAPDGGDPLEIYSDKPTTLLQRIIKAVKETMGWK